MDIIFATNKLSKVCNALKNLQRVYGPQKAKKIQQRLFDLHAAETLADMSYLPPARCHALTGDRIGQFAVDTAHPNRLIFEPAHDPIPYLEDGSIDRRKVTAVRILDVDIDYHG